MALPDDARAQPGGDVWETYAALERFIESTDFVVGSPGLTFNRTEDGTVAELLDENPWAHPFEVSAGNFRVQVSEGFLSEEIPTIRVAGTNELQTIDGLDSRGRFVGFPVLWIEPPEESPITFVCLRVLIDPENGALLRDEDDNVDPSAVQIVHRFEKPKRTADGGSEADLDDDGLAVGYDVIARLTWSQDLVSIIKIGQVIHWHRGYSFKRGDGEEIPNRFFPFHA